MNSSRYGGHAHKTPCENSGCGQNLCVEARKHPGATLHLKCVICLGKDAEIARLKEHLATTEADRKGQVVDTQKYRDMWLDAEAKLAAVDLNGELALYSERGDLLAPMTTGRTWIYNVGFGAAIRVGE